MAPHSGDGALSGHSASPQPNVLGSPQHSDFSPEFWGLIVLTGVGTGLAAGLLMKLLRFVQHMAWRYQTGPFLDAVEKMPDALRVLVLVGTGVLVASILPLLGRLKSNRPSELEATIWFSDGRLPPFKTALKAVFSIVIVGLGASLGREAAPKQAGTLIASLLAKWRGLSSTKRRLLAACGAGAGIAAVYNVPFGGALFALEVLLGTLSLPLVAPAFLATMTGTATAWLLLPNEPTYHVPSMPLTPGLVVWALLFAPIAGVASAAFVKLIGLAAALKPKGWLIPVAALVVFPGLGLLATVYPQLLGNGKDVVELASVDKFALPTLAILLLLKPVATAACLGTGAPGGLFTPTMTFGALLGGVLGHLWLHVWPDAPAGAFALVGAGVVLAATTKGPISALVLMLELTRHLDGLLVPLLLATAGAVSVAHRLDPRSTYTSRLSGDASTAGSDKASTATRFGDLLQMSLRSQRDLTILDETGNVVGLLSSGDIVAASQTLAPLEIATALDAIEAKQACTFAVPARAMVPVGRGR